MFFDIAVSGPAFMFYTLAGLIVCLAAVGAVLTLYCAWQLLSYLWVRRPKISCAKRLGARPRNRGGWRRRRRSREDDDIEMSSSSTRARQRVHQPGDDTLRRKKVGSLCTFFTNFK